MKRLVNLIERTMEAHYAALDPLKCAFNFTERHELAAKGTINRTKPTIGLS